MKRILFLTQGDERVASSRHRVYQYLPALQKAGFETVVHPAVAPEEFQNAFLERSLNGDVQRLFKTFVRRVRDLHEVRDYDFIFIQKPILPAPFFNVESKFSRETKTIFDFDDAIYLKKVGGSSLSNLWSQKRRITSICKHAHKVVVGNEHLADFVRTLGVDPIVIPTTVETRAYENKLHTPKGDHKIPVIGWMGSPSTQADLKMVVPGLVQLHSKAPFVVRIIGGNPEAIPVRFPIEWRTWNLETSVEDISHLDFGLAPLMDTEWNLGKCGLKILQYWAAGVPVVASPVGVYKTMIQHGENGFLASNPAEWTQCLLELMTDSKLYQKITTAGRKTVLEKYSVENTLPTYTGLFEK